MRRRDFITLLGGASIILMADLRSGTMAWTSLIAAQVNQAAIVENKRLGPVLAYIAEKQKELDMSRSAKAPRRRGQRNHMFKVG